MGKTISKKPKILVALSGGVDSAVSAALLVAAGYDVTGVFVINYEGKNTFGEECWVPEYRDAVRVAAHLNIPILRWNFVEEYRKNVLDYMFREYEAGKTPNPDILCNKFVKFGSWLSKARELGFDYLATGHYAKLDKQILSHLEPVPSERVRKLLVPKDIVKDQTYFLHQMNQQQLKNTLFPLANYTKTQVRMLAKKFDLPVAVKEESMGICFIGEVPMKEFLQQRIKPHPGSIILANGETIGKHDGLSFYTIGQRHFALQHPGGDSRPLYVLGKRTAGNELVVGYEDDPLMNRREIEVSDIHWISGQPPLFPLTCEVRLRHRQELQTCTVWSENGSIVIECKEPQRSVTPGQFAVLYKKGECLGGGAVI